MSPPTRFSASAGLSAPRINRAAAAVKVGSPAMGRYSWFRSGSSRKTASACQTTAGQSIHSTEHTEASQQTHLLDDGQHPRLRIVVAIGSDAQIHLLVESVRLVRGDEAE
jgi:hypothetical protein